MDTLSDRLNIALWTKPPRPLVGDVERSGESRRGEVGDVWLSNPPSTLGGSNFCALDKGSGDPRPVAVETDDMLEYRFPRLLSAKLEPALDGGGDCSSVISE